MNAIITLERFAYAPHGTFGRLTMPCGFSCYTVERPWMGNAPSVSCIPEGVYDLRKRESPVVQRTNKGEFSEGWEVTLVPGRTFIMLHPANTMHDIEGCIGMGDELGSLGGLWAVLNSRHTFGAMMGHLDKRDEWQIHINHKRASYP